MNKEIIIQNLEEAREELATTIAEIQSDPEYDEEVLREALNHAYHHINMAWNTRNIPIDRYANLSETDFSEWSQFPNDVLDY